MAPSPPSPGPRRAEADPGDQAALAGPTYLDLLLARLSECGAAPMLHHKDRALTGTEFQGSIFRYARALARLGIARGSLVALFAPNAPDALAIRYATHLLGAAAVYLPAPPSPQHRAEMIAQVDPGLLVVFPETMHLLPGNITARIATVGPCPTENSIRLDLLAAEESCDSLASLARPGDLGVVISSGGSTGIPKGSWRSFATYSAIVQAPSPADRRQLVNGRLAYLSQVLVDTTLLGGGTVVLADHFEAAETLATVEAERITDLFLVEPQLFELMDHPDVGRRDLSSLRAITHIGASAPPTLRRRALKHLGCVLAHVYGASEMGLVSVLPPAEYGLAQPELLTCAGRVLPGVEVVFRREDGRIASPGEVGRIEVRSSAVAGGYRNRPELQKAFRDGWYQSGDLGFMDARGYLHILGRAADVAWVNGVMLSPTLLEDRLCQQPFLRYAAVVMDQEAEVWIAAVTPWPGAQVDIPQCRQEIAARFGAAAAARLRIVPLDHVPLTEQGKPDRGKICALGHEAGDVPDARVRTT